ncbi:hypothetical protein [Chitinimonas lacunae]|uniref:Nitrogen fixation protein n=1 Tax=Chitinimonas lacunae TaxID=1963018 RepID=A0ABV8MU43_9NEIS
MSTQGAMCPSAPWQSEGAQIIGIVGGSADAPEVTYLKEAVSPTAELVERLGDVAPEEVFRVAAPCAKSSCMHHDGHHCSLVTRIVEAVPVVFDRLAPCAIRATCVWWAQEGREACKRCPQVVTHNHRANELMTQAAQPPVRT